MFNNRFFHQIKGTAMGTPMAVNFSNCFMSSFEKKMLQCYEQIYGLKPALWLRYIDDIFIVWVGDTVSFKHFMTFCDNYAQQNNYASNIRFTASPPSKSVNFLDTTVTLNNDGSLASTLYSKPTAAHQYLHRSSYHVGHTLRSLPKSQFMRIRRICSSLVDYTHHATIFVEFFVKRGYNRKSVVKTAN